MSLAEILPPPRVNVSVSERAENVRTAHATNYERVTYPSVSIVGTGPSLEDYWDELDGEIWALNGAGKWLNAKGIVPDKLVIIDALPSCADFVQCEAGEYLLASQCAPETFAACPKSPLIWDAACLEPEVAVLLEGKDPIGGGVSVGSRAINLAFALGKRTIRLYGLDSSASGEKHYVDGTAWREKESEDDIAGHDIGVPEFHPPHLLAGKQYLTTTTMVRQVEAIWSQYEKLRQVGVRIEPRCDGLLRDWFDAYTAPEFQERLKYEHIWQYPDYRIDCHSLVEAPQALEFYESLGAKPADTLVEYGSGTGRALKWFQDRNFSVIGIDIAENALDQNLKGQISVVNAPLWGNFAVRGNFGICCDVMEHIPPDKVDKVLENIARTTKAVYFRIAFYYDKHGPAKLGLHLHLTVRTREWWEEKLKAHFDFVEGEGDIFKCWRNNA